MAFTTAPSANAEKPNHASVLTKKPGSGPKAFST